MYIPHIISVHFSILLTPNTQREGERNSAGGEGRERRGIGWGGEGHPVSGKCLLT